MKPQVACLMACSVDGRTLHNRWRPKGAGAALFEQVHDELAGDAWLVGRENGSQSGSMRPPHRVARLHYGHSLARASEFAGGHQARGACADDDDVVRARSGHMVIEPLRLLRPRSGSGNAAASRHPPTPGCSPASSP
jgi:hypothetical protein